MKYHPKLKNFDSEFCLKALRTLALGVFVQTLSNSLAAVLHRPGMLDSSTNTSESMKTIAPIGVIHWVIKQKLADGTLFSENSQMFTFLRNGWDTVNTEGRPT